MGAIRVEDVTFLRMATRFGKIKYLLLVFFNVFS